MDATNVDLKAFTEDFYRRVTLSHLAPVLETLDWLAKTRVWTEVTNLMIPGLNDEPAETRALSEWLLEHMGPDVPLHFTAFHPDFKMLDRPPTPPGTLSRARAVAREVGLHHVYTGNVHDSEGQTTYCPGCGKALIERDWHDILSYRLDGDRCEGCRTALAGRFGARVVPTVGRRTYLGLA
jgi:pyruvate formate lyase activating enzyme